MLVLLILVILVLYLLSQNNNIRERYNDGTIIKVYNNNATRSDAWNVDLSGFYDSYSSYPYDYPPNYPYDDKYNYHLDYSRNYPNDHVYKYPRVSTYQDPFKPHTRMRTSRNHPDYFPYFDVFDGIDV
jgi:hypothetical protein